MFDWDDPLGVKSESKSKRQVSNKNSGRQLEEQAGASIEFEIGVNETVSSTGAVAAQSKTAEAPSSAAEALPSAAEALASVAPVNADEKRVINGRTDINQLAPFK